MGTVSVARLLLLPGYVQAAAGTVRRRGPVVLIALFIGVGVAELVAQWRGIGPALAIDVNHYLIATHRWLDTGSPYYPPEVAGPFRYSIETFLHPPIALWLFAPFLVLPLPLWWTPVVVVALFIRWCRPSPWAWVYIAFALGAYFPFHAAVIVGNTDLWVWMGVALGLRFGWPALVMVVKPTMFPLLLAGARRRTFWLAVPVVALMCVPFGSLWVDWIHVVVNGPGGLFYSLPALPWLLVPVIAWRYRTTSRSAGSMVASANVLPLNVTVPEAPPSNSSL